MPETATMQSSAVERFLRYVTFDTQSAEGSSTHPSTLKQLVLLDQLVTELQAIGLDGRRARRARLRHGDDSGHDQEEERAHRRLPRPRRHVARDVRRQREADRPPQLARRRHRAARRQDRRDASSPTIPPCANRSATTSSPPPAPRCSAPTTRPALRRSSPPPSSSSLIRRFRTARFASASRPTRRSAAGPLTST